MGRVSLRAVCICASVLPGSCSAPSCLKMAGVLVSSSAAASHPTPPDSFRCWWEKSNLTGIPPHSSRNGCIHILLSCVARLAQHGPSRTPSLPALPRIWSEFRVSRDISGRIKMGLQQPKLLDLCRSLGHTVFELKSLRTPGARNASPLLR